MERPQWHGGAEGPDEDQSEHGSGETPPAKERGSGYSMPNLQSGLNFRLALVLLVAILWLAALLVHSCVRQDKSSSTSSYRYFFQSSISTLVPTHGVTMRFLGRELDARAVTRS